MDEGRNCPSSIIPLPSFFFCALLSWWRIFFIFSLPHSCLLYYYGAVKASDKALYVARSTARGLFFCVEY